MEDKFLEESVSLQLAEFGEKVSRLKELVDQMQILEYSTQNVQYICPICVHQHPRSHRQECELLALLKEANKGFADLYK